MVGRRRDGLGKASVGGQESAQHDAKVFSGRDEVGWGALVGLLSGC